MWGGCNTNTGGGASTNGFTAASSPLPRGWTFSPRPGSALLQPLSFTPPPHGQFGQNGTFGPVSAAPAPIAWSEATGSWEQQLFAARTPPLPPPTNTMPSSLPAPTAAGASAPQPPPYAAPAGNMAGLLSLTPEPSLQAAGPPAAPPALSLWPQASAPGAWEQQQAWGGRAGAAPGGQAPVVGGRFGKCDPALPDDALLLGNGFGGSCANEMLLEMLGNSRLNDNEVGMTDHRLAFGKSLGPLAVSCDAATCFRWSNVGACEAVHTAVVRPDPNRDNGMHLQVWFETSLTPPLPLMPAA